MASTPDNNTEDALVKSSPIGAQAAPDDDDLVELSPIGAQADPDDDDVQIVGAPRAIKERNPKKRKSNDGWKRPAISKKQQKHPVISDTDLERQLDRVRDVSLQNAVDSSLQATATQAPDEDSNDGANEVTNVTKYFTMNVTVKKVSAWWEGFDLFIPSRGTFPRGGEDRGRLLQLASLRGDNMNIEHWLPQCRSTRTMWTYFAQS